jgi:hypothetical protein
MDNKDLLAGCQLRVAAAGYTWVETKDGPVLVERQSRASRRIYSPFSEGHAALFLTFSQLEPTPQAIVAFADEYGLLGQPVTQSVEHGRVSTARTFDKHGRDLLQRGELLDADLVSKRSQAMFRRYGVEYSGWVDHITALSGILQSVRSDRKGESLWDASGYTLSLGMSRHRPQVLSTKTGLPPEPLPLNPAKEAGMKKMQRLFIADRLSAVLRKFVVPRLEWRDSPQRFRLAFEPNSLLGCLWLQLAMAMCGSKEFRACAREGCSHLVELSTDPRTGRRADARFCSTACRTGAYRHRKTQARALADNGVPLPEIASRLTSDPVTVQRWIAPRRRLLASRSGRQNRG